MAKHRVHFGEMPSPTKSDPRSYVRMRPPPSPSHRAIKIDARSATIYTASTPSRDEVRKDNYDRRYDQMTQRGFWAVSYKPYKGIGDPFYLDERKLIMHALGQWDESEEDDSYSSPEEESDSDTEVKVQTPKPNTPAKFVLKRSRKGLNTLGKEVTHGRNMVRNVRLGHGLFHLINQERQAKQQAVENALRERSERLKREWQPPKIETGSDQESSEDDLAEDVDLRNYMSPGREDFFLTDTPMPTLDSGTGKVAFSGLSGSDFKSRPSTVHSGTSTGTPRPGSKKKRAVQRPYTAQHTNIGRDEPGRHKESIFHQLCALYWLLEAMNTDSLSSMGPICTSWHFKEIGGQKVSTRKLQKEKTTETSWNQFVSQPSCTKGFWHVLIATKRFTANRSKRSLGLGRGLVPPSSARNSLTGSSSPNSSISQLNIGQADGQKSPNFDTIREDEEAIRKATPISEKGHEEKEEEDTNQNKNLFRFLDEYYASLRRVDGGGAESQPANPEMTVSVHNDVTPQSSAKQRGKTPRKPKKSSETPTFTKTDLSGQSDSRLGSTTTRAVSAGMIRPRSSPALVEYQASLPSNKFQHLSHSLRQRFSEVGEEKALDLHDTLHQIERQRLKVCQNKFTALNNISSHFHRAIDDIRTKSVHEEKANEKLRRTSSFSVVSHDKWFHRAIDDIRTKSVHEEKANEKLRRTSAHSPWFSDLVRNIPQEYRTEWQFREIIEKLAKYGMRDQPVIVTPITVEGSKHSAYKLLKVLTTLRQWEICSPDVSAAIEFCREKIVDMSIEEYEEWFQQQFPTVLRPQTAPSTMRSSRK
ncbi:LOW QUALITY PROTEIN: coiled-coil domain-containing protein 60-like [Lineus longissimus]|uniref:LOW QUALITY PROTEIN: coiled-coil domain-containing protein 60-like n=1 Tax=Lineus longissimus TaxID=88925 RepID=UPI00315D65FA